MAATSGVTFDPKFWTKDGYWIGGTGTTSTTSATGTIPSSSNSLLEGAVSDVLGLKSTAVTQSAAADAATTQAEGYTKESEAYTTAAETASQNSVLAGVIGGVKSLQQERDVGLNLGSQVAAQAANGFGASGSSLDLLRSSLQQGYLTQQLTATQTALNQGGYLEESAAAVAQKAATDITAAGAASTASTYKTASALSTANAAKETAAITNFTGTNTLTSDQSLILAPLTGNVTTADVPVAAGQIVRPLTPRPTG